MKSFEWVIILVLCYLPVYVLSKSIIEPLPGFVLKRLNKAEQILLIPLGLVYNLLSCLFLYKIFFWTGLEPGKEVVALVFSELYPKAELGIQLTQSLKQSPKNSAILSVLFGVAYFIFFTFIIPHYAGTYLGKRNIRIFLWEELKRSWRKLMPTHSLLRGISKKSGLFNIESAIRIYLIYLRALWEFRGIIVEILNPLNWIVDFFRRFGILDAYIRFISVDLTPKFVKDFYNDTHCYVLDIVLSNGKMFSGILDSYDVDQGGGIRSLSLTNCLRWPDKNKGGDDKSDKSKDGDEEDDKNKASGKLKKVSGDLFAIPYGNIQEINISKIPRHQIFWVGENVNIDDSISKIIRYIEDKSKQHRSWIYNKCSFYVCREHDAGKLESKIKESFYFFHEPEFFYDELGEENFNLLAECYFTEAEKRALVIRVDDSLVV